jgi:hypothetical protein
MNRTHKVGLVFAVVLGGWHAVWALLVMLGVAQKLVDTLLWAHMINIDYVVGPFDVSAALTLILVTALMGYAFGYVASLAWKKIHGQEELVSSLCRCRG